MKLPWRRRRHKPILFQQIRRERKIADREAAGKLPTRIVVYNLTMQALAFIGRGFASIILSLALTIAVTALIQERSPIEVMADAWHWVCR